MVFTSWNIFGIVLFRALRALLLIASIAVFCLGLLSGMELRALVLAVSMYGLFPAWCFHGFITSLKKSEDYKQWYENLSDEARGLEDLRLSGVVPTLSRMFKGAGYFVLALFILGGLIRILHAAFGG